MLADSPREWIFSLTLSHRYCLNKVLIPVTEFTFRIALSFKRQQNILIKSVSSKLRFQVLAGLLISCVTLINLFLNL